MTTNTHQFVSISEQEWKSGENRHRCAECLRDYGDPIHCATSTVCMWPLVIIIEDCYVPEWAGEIVKFSRNTPTETHYAVIHALAVYAELNLVKERLN